MTPTQNDTAETKPIPAFDTLQEVGQWMVDNDQVLSKLEDAIMASDPNDTPTAEFMQIHKELGGVTGMLQAAVNSAGPAIRHIEELKAKYGIT